MWPAGERFPASVCWLPAAAARRVGVRPPLPTGAAGCLVYRYNARGGHLRGAAGSGGRTRRAGEVLPVAAGRQASEATERERCTFDGGRRVFRTAGDPDLGIHLCEGPLDALAIVHLERLGLVALHGGAVHGTSGAALFRPAACPGRGPVTVWAQNDPEHQGQHAAVKLRRALAGRAVTIRLPPHGFKDWAARVQAVGEDRAEREAIQHE